MRLAFIDMICAYDAARPDKPESLGGTTSAVCFVARELASRGVSCTLFNRIAAPSQADGIPALPIAMLGAAMEAGGFDAYIFCGRWAAEIVNLTRAHTRAPLIAWMHESIFAEPLTPALPAFDAAVYVSNWQKSINQAVAQPHWKQTVIRNAMNPLVTNSFAANENILDAKDEPPLLLYVGAFARGAFHIPPLLDKLRAHRTDFTVEMYCNLDPSHDAEKDAAYIAWLRALPNIAHVGPVGQGDLTLRMRRAALMLAPNPWPETSCIALIESLASGMQAVITGRAALPETASGFAQIIPIDNADEPQGFDMPVDYDAFAAEILKALDRRETDREALESDLRRQVTHFNAHYQWEQRAASWLDFLAALQPRN